MKIWYALAKTLAEQAAWQFAEANGLDLVTVLPSFVIGPSLPFQLCSTASDVLGLLKGNNIKAGVINICNMSHRSLILVDRVRNSREFDKQEIQLNLPGMDEWAMFISTTLLAATSLFMKILMPRGGTSAAQE